MSSKHSSSLSKHKHASSANVDIPFWTTITESIFRRATCWLLWPWGQSGDANKSRKLAPESYKTYQQNQKQVLRGASYMVFCLFQNHFDTFSVLSCQLNCNLQTSCLSSQHIKTFYRLFCVCMIFMLFWWGIKFIKSISEVLKCVHVSLLHVTAHGLQQ